MSKCTKCGVNFVGTPEYPPGQGLCRYCEIQQLKRSNAELAEKLQTQIGANEILAKRLMEAAGVLRLLHDNQNGCPLPKYEKQWTEAIERAGKVLNKLGK